MFKKKFDIILLCDWGEGYAHHVKNWDVETPPMEFRMVCLCPPTRACPPMRVTGFTVILFGTSGRVCFYLGERHGTDASTIAGVTMCVQPELNQTDLHESFLYKIATVVVLTVFLATHARHNQIYTVLVTKYFLSDSHL